MNFLKENAFLVSTAAVLVIASTGLLVWASREGGTGSDYAALRTKYSREIAALSRPPRVNKGVVDAAEQRVSVMRGHHLKVAEDFLERGSGYPVMRFAVEDVGADRPRRAFPIVPKLYDQRGLRLVFPVRYRDEVKALLASLRPTEPPTKEEVDKERERAEAKSAAAGVAPAGSRSAGYSGGPATPAGGPGKSEPTPAEIALRKLVLAKAAEGWVYADESAMHVALPAVMNYPNDELYLAQVTLWVQQDVIAAIRKTNDDAQRRFAVKKLRGVAGSAIKRLVGLNVRGYVMRQRPRALPAYGAGGPGPRVGPMAARQAAGRVVYVGFATMKSVPVPMLTERVCNKLYEVVHYDFTVVGSDQELLRLYTNLLARNYHTILDVRIDEPGQQPAQAGAPMRALGAPAEDRYDYGPHPVVQARIVGELLLLADFTRGRWDEKAKEWHATHPPLMPAEFLRKMNEVDPGALREEDKERLK